MSTAITGARCEQSRRGRGVRFEAESDLGKGEFLIAEEALADLEGGHRMNESDYLAAFESHADVISEAAGRFIAAGAVLLGQLVIITRDDLFSQR